MTRQRRHRFSRKDVFSSKRAAGTLFHLWGPRLPQYRRYLCRRFTGILRGLSGAANCVLIGTGKRHCVWFFKIFFALKKPVKEAVIYLTEHGPGRAYSRIY